MRLTFTCGADRSCGLRVVKAMARVESAEREAVAKKGLADGIAEVCECKTSGMKNVGLGETTGASYSPLNVRVS